MGQRFACFPGSGTAKPAKEAGETTPLKTEVTQFIEDQAHDVEEEGLQGYLGSFYPCRVVAPINFEFLEDNRGELLWIAHILCMVALLFAFLAFYGGFAHTSALENLSWVALDSPLGRSYAGVKWVCWDLPSPPEKGTFGDGVSGVIPTGDGQFYECKLWLDMDCGISPAQTACEVCKVHAKGMYFSVFMAVFSFFGLYSSTVKRMDGRDSNYVKFMAVMSCLIGGANFLFSAASFWHSCIFSVHASGSTVTTGVGLQLILTAAVFKVLMGFVHLGLPVENTTYADEKKMQA